METLPGIQRRIEFVVTPGLRERFWQKVHRCGEDECWNWTGALRDGYGAIGNRRKVLGAHIVSYRIHHGEVPDGLCVLHSCDNPACCNPKHLSAGTHQQNMRDMFARGRRDVRGEKGANAHITNADVLLIHAIRAVLGIGPHRTSQMLGISRKICERVVYRERWTHIDPPDADTARTILKERGIECPG